MKIRRALSVDAAALATVERQQPQAAGWGVAGFVAELKQPCAWIWCAEKQNQLVGFVALRAAADSAEILNVAVTPEYSRQRIGTALLAWALEQLHTCGVIQVSLEVAQDNLPAQRLYAKSGLQVLGQRKDFYGPGRHALILGKKL